MFSLLLEGVNLLKDVFSLKGVILLKGVIFLKGVFLLKALLAPCGAQLCHSQSGGVQDFGELLNSTEDPVFLEHYEIGENGWCPLVGGMAALLPYNGRCAPPLSFLLCEFDSHWLVLDRASGNATCRLQQCMGNALEFKGNCIQDPKDPNNSPCPETMELTTNVFGEGECDCPYTHVFHDGTGRCFLPYTRGPCDSGQSLQKLDENEAFRCQKNVCEREGAVAVTESCRQVRPSGRGEEESYLCYKHWRDWQGPCSAGLSLQLNLVTKEVACDVMDQGYKFKNLIQRYRPCTDGSKRRHCPTHSGPAKPRPTERPTRRRRRRPRPSPWRNGRVSAPSSGGPELKS